MRPTRSKRPPVAADGSLLTAPKKRKYSARKSLDVESNSHQSISQTPEQEEESQNDSLSSLSDNLESEEVEEVVDEDDGDGALEIILPTKQIFQRSTTQPQAQKTIPQQIRTNRSPLNELSNEIKENQLLQAKKKILSVLTGNLPPPTKDEKGRFDGNECIGLQEQWKTLHTTINGTLRGEGNSALLVGAPGTGKKLLLDSVLRSFENEGDQKSPFHLVRLDATLQPTDRLSLRELARQLVQAGAIRLPKEGEEGGLQLDLEGEDGIEDIQEEEGDFGLANGNQTEEGAIGEEANEATELQNAILSSLANTTSTILTLLSSEQAKSKSNLPLVIVLSSFDLYTTRPRQALLYVLLDAVQAGSYTPGLCVIGTTSRLDTTDLLEKRVRSRFSGRIINVWTNTKWTKMLERVMLLGISKDESEQAASFSKALKEEIELIENNKDITEMLTLWESIGNDCRSLYRALFPIIASVSIENASILNALLIETHKAKQNIRNTLDELTTPEFALLIAAKQLLNKECEIFNFAMCFEEVQKFISRIERERIGAGTSVVDLRRFETGGESSPSKRKGITSSHINVQWAGLSDRKRVMMAFRSLLSLELFQPESILNSLSLSTSNNLTTITAATAAKRSAQTAKTDFMRVKCTLFPQTIIEAAKSKNRIEPLGIQLVQWANSQS